MEQEAVFLIVGNEKTHAKDFELSQEGSFALVFYSIVWIKYLNICLLEKDMFFANEFMKGSLSTKFSKNEKNSSKHLLFMWMCDESTLIQGDF